MFHARTALPAGGRVRSAGPFEQDEPILSLPRERLVPAALHLRLLRDPFERPAKEKGIEWILVPKLLDEAAEERFDVGGADCVQHAGAHDDA